MDRRNFLKSCALVVGVVGAGAIYSSVTQYFGASYDIQKALKNKDDFIPELDVHLVEHCNLSCKYCCHFSNIAETEFLDIKEFEKDLKRLYEITQGKSKGFILLGGEPLLHPQINDFIELTRKIFPISYIEIITNGLLFKSMPDSFWKCMHDNSVVLKHSLYPGTNVDIDYYYKMARKYGVRTYFKRKELQPTESFFKLNIDLEGKVDYVKRFENCEMKDFCNQMSKGRIFHCWFGPGIRHFNKKFNKNVELVEEDYLDIYKAKDANEIFEFFRRAPKICRFCDYIKEWEKDWESSPIHDISEWTY
ncbi:radical SAM protein [bacterium]|nr:radical SAM protein [bacterium]